MELLRQLLLRLCALALLGSLVRALMPEGKTKRLCVNFCGMLLALAALNGAGEFDRSGLSQAFARARMQAEQTKTGVEIQNREALCAIIKVKSEAYILDKAEELGLDLTAEVQVDDSGSYPYPAEVTLFGEAAPGLQLTLSRLIEENLAIGKEKQHWSSE